MIRNCIFIRKHSSKNGINHITGDIHYGILGLIGRKSVLTIHDDYAMTMAKKGCFDKIFKWLFWIFLPIKFADVVVCTNDYVKKRIAGYYKSKKLKVITHQVVPDGLNPKGKPFDKLYPCILQMGAGGNKNLDTTLEVLKGLPCKLVVFKKMSEAQIQKAKSYGIDFVNKYNLPFEDVIKSYDEADIVVFPSLFEGMGIPIFEGQASGKPVITTNREPMNWVAGEGAVLLDDPLNVDEYRNKLLKVINDDAYREDIVRKGIKNAKRFSLDRVASAYNNLYLSILPPPIKIISKLFSIITIFLPWRLKRFILNHCYHYKIHPKAHIGLSYVFPKYLEMNEGATIGHLNVGVNLDKIVLGKNSHIGRSNWITGFPTMTDSIHFAHDFTRRSELIVGDESSITKHHHIDCTNAIHIGHHVTIAGYYSQLLTHSIDIYEGRQDSHPISIGDYCFVSTGVKMLGGSILPDYSVLAAGAVIGKAFNKPYYLYGGVPAKTIKEISKNAKYMTRENGFVW
ncbi:MAG: glycosyltransferase [Prevotella sp.]